MASRSTRHALTCIGLTHGIADSIERSYKSPPKTVKSHVDRIRARCHECFDLWPDKLTRAEIDAIEARMTALEETIVNGKADVSVMTSVALALLVELHEVVGAKKRLAIDRLISACQQMHRYYDRRLDKFAAYELADRAVGRLEH